MAFTFEQEPVNTTSKVPVITNWTPLIGYMVYRSDSIASWYFYKLVLEVRLDDASGTLLAKIKQRRNGYSSDVTNNRARAFFDLRDIVNSQLQNTVTDQNEITLPYRTIHKVGVNTTAKPFSVNDNQLKTIYVKAYEFYSTAATTPPSDQTGSAINDTLHYMQASLPLMTARSGGVASGYIQTTAFAIYNGSSATDLFLSDVETSAGDYNISGYINYIQETDYHTVAFLNDNANFDSDIDFIEVVYYNSSGVKIGDEQYIPNVSGSGGEAPTDGSLTDSERLLYFGCGPGNLEASTVTPNGGSAGDAQPSNFSGWAYYTIRGTGNATGTIAYKTATYYFIKQSGSCKDFKVRRLAWRNSVGGYDYFNFKMKSTQTINVQRDNYNSMLGTFNRSKWFYNNTQRGKTTRQTTANLTEMLNTDWITEQDANLLEKLIMSTDVYVVENADTDFTQAVMVKDSTFVKKTKANDNMIKYTINIEYANPVNTNS